ncbi:hypothetical protein ALC53_08525 [Atta colombica]|uniref:Uncharacterized protein n=1 Tax=Atta colombica TaxID=520822 RepID=A0A195BAC8_9HYME|nr:hypothetical protein ALC53_08525 [Atta colombica]
MWAIKGQSFPVTRQPLLTLVPVPCTSWPGNAVAAIAFGMRYAFRFLIDLCSQYHYTFDVQRDDHDDDDDEELLNALGKTYADPSLDCIKANKSLRISIITSSSPDEGISRRKDWSNGMRRRRESARICRLRASSSDLRARMWHRQSFSQFSDLDAKHLPSKLSLISFDAAVSNVKSSDSDHRKTWREFCRSVIMRVCILQMDNVTVSSLGILNYTTSTI